jgi:hypothetical protein
MDRSWFSLPAIERIAACASSGMGESLTPEQIVEQYLATEVNHGLAGKDFEQPSFDQLFGFPQAPGIVFYCFAGLIALAVDARYLDLRDWSLLSRFDLALDRFLELESRSDDATDLRDLKEFKDSAAVIRTDHDAVESDVFYAFAAYLHLTESVRSCEASKKFLALTAEDWHHESDLAFLATPGHFAEAMATGKVAGLPAEDAAAGVETLRYFAWLTEILARFPQKLQDKVIRHARWSHHVLRVRWRLGLWVERMQEWEEEAGIDITETGEFFEEMLRPSRADLQRLELLERAGGTLKKPGGEIVQVSRQVHGFKDETTERFLAEGRVGAALRILRAEAQRQSNGLRNQRAQGAREEFARSLIATCLDIERAGDRSTATVLLASHIESIIPLLKGDHMLERALELLKAGRAPEVRKEAMTSVASTESHPTSRYVAVVQEASATRTRSVGGESKES